MLMHRLFLFYYLPKKYTINARNFETFDFLTIQKPGHESSVFFQRNEEIKLTTIMSTLL